jgi:hypothetical protein
MPVFNAGRFVAEAIQSVLDQDFEDFELVIVDGVIYVSSGDSLYAIEPQIAAGTTR